MKKLLIVFLLIGTLMCSLYSQNKIIEGRVISEHFDILAGVSIMSNDTIEIGKTDINGFFQINIPVSEKKITFVFIGLESTTIELVDKCNKIEVVMMYIYTYDFMTLRRAERKREKRYKKLSEIHKQAFEKGMFKTESACYNRKFEPYYLDEN